MHRVAIFAALPWECRTVLRPLREVRRTRLGAFTMWQGRASEREVWVVKTGDGDRRAATAVDAACAAQASLYRFDGLRRRPRIRAAARRSHPRQAVSGDGTSAAVTTAAAPRARP